MKLYGWPVSPYTEKTRAYLAYRGIEFAYRQPAAWMLYRTIPKAVGKSIMPTVRLPDGTWMQDSAVLIDWAEEAFAGPSITPPGPQQRLAAELVGLYGDEWLPMAALHYRWNVPANKAFALSEFGRYALPWLPGALSRPAVAPIAGKMAGYLPLLGVTPETIPGLEARTTQLIAGLNEHLSAHDYLLGGAACVGDFALYGPLWAHLFRDPGTTALFDAAPAVRAWMKRLEDGVGPTGPFLADDAVPASLDFLFADQFADQWPYVSAVLDAVDDWVADNPGASRVPRSLGATAFALGGTVGQRKLITFVAWKAQRVLDARADASAGWLRRVGGQALLDAAPRTRQIRRGFRLALA